jgi:hypothetical protein
MDLRMGLKWLRKAGNAGLVLEVTNEGGAPLEDFKVEWCVENETRQQFPIGDMPAWGGSDRLLLSQEQGVSGTLAPGETRTFLMGPDYLDAERSRVAALSPERYRFEALSGETVVGVIPGDVAGAFIAAG